MKNRMATSALFTPAFLAYIMFCGCAHSPTPRLYLLKPVARVNTDDKKESVEKPPLIMRPVKMAAYLNRPQIILRKGEREVAHAQFDRWAEPLEEQVNNYLADSLAVELKNHSIKPFAWRGNNKAQLEIQISILAMDGRPGDSVSLRAEWQLLSPSKEFQIVDGGRCDLKISCEHPGIPGVVAATEKALDALSNNIAESLNKDE